MLSCPQSSKRFYFDGSSLIVRTAPKLYSKLIGRLQHTPSLAMYLTGQSSDVWSSWPTTRTSPTSPVSTRPTYMPMPTTRSCKPQVHERQTSSTSVATGHATLQVSQPSVPLVGHNLTPTRLSGSTLNPSYRKTWASISRLSRNPSGFSGSWPRCDTGLWTVQKTSGREDCYSMLSSSAFAAATSATYCSRTGHVSWHGGIMAIQSLPACHTANLNTLAGAERRYSATYLPTSPSRPSLCKSHVAAMVANKTPHRIQTAH